MSHFAGTGKLLRLALRRDRIKLLVWILTLGGLFLLFPSSATEVYDTPADRQAYAMSSAVSAIARAFNGPITGIDAGSVALAETFTFMSIFVALMSTLLIIRHTRQNEETGRAEMIEAGAVGRYAMLSAALLLAVGANLVVGCMSALGYLLADLPVEGSWLAGAAMAMVGIIFAGIAAITAQITESSRAANGMAAATIGVAFLLRAIGDMQGKVQPSGTEVISAWPTWLSPIGWARESHPFTENYWWMLAVMATVFGVLIYCAFRLRAHRDINAGLFAVRKGRATAPKSLNGTLGLIWRLQRGMFFGWAAGIGVMAVSLGAVTKEVTSITGQNPEAAALIAQLGGTQNLVDAYIAFSVSLLGMAIAGYAVQALLRMRTEESLGYLEPLLATAVRRPAWMMSFVVIAATGAVLLLLVVGLAAGGAYAIADSNIEHILTLTGAALVQLPAVLLLGSLAAVCFGLVPRWAIAVSWLLFAVTTGVSQFGELLKLPDWIKNLSPFAHTPLLPAEDVEWMPLLILSAIAALFVGLSLLAFRRRDLAL